MTPTSPDDREPITKMLSRLLAIEIESDSQERQLLADAEKIIAAYTAKAEKKARKDQNRINLMVVVNVLSWAISRGDIDMVHTSLDKLEKRLKHHINAELERKSE